ncbi:hypothetical protein [Salmonella phage SSBI34]|nr:hypothetical protein [Salmonella phage SSBI34]
MNIQEQVKITFEDLVELHKKRKYQKGREKKAMEDVVLFSKGGHGLSKKEANRKVDAAWATQRDAVNIISGIDKQIEYELNAIGQIINFVAEKEGDK